ncbi:MAG TPA: acyl-CoA dehydrogenase [Mycobacteriales bacterium]|nr:acyl-CoA dehydrogenase [Mycobacteriales bacterium]
MTAAPEALEFAATVRDLLARSADSVALRVAWDSDDGRIPGLWSSLAGLGALGLVVPDKYGGAGLDLTAAVPLLTEAGRACLPEPVLETIAGAVVLAVADGDAAEHWLPRVAEGASIGLGVGPGALVSGAPWADLLLLADGKEIHALAPGDAVVAPVESADRGVRLATVEWTAEPATRLGIDVGFAQDVVAVASAAVLVGAAEAMLDMAVKYALTREQFGRVIGSFQAVKHQLADCYVATSFAAPVVARGAWAMTRDEPGRTRNSSHAKLAVSAAAARAARTALQVHAGIGYTFEHDLHMWLKRTWTLRSLYGDETWHRARAAAAVLGVTPGAVEGNGSDASLGTLPT